MSSSESIRFDRIAEEYDATRGYPEGVEDDVADLLVRAGELSAGASVLEVGAGTGRLALPLARRVGGVVGLDLSAPMLAKLGAKRAGEPARPVRGDATALPFRDGAFDAVLAVHVFHLIPGWREALGEVLRVLRPGAPLLHAFDRYRGDGVAATAIAEASAAVRARSAGDEAARLEDVGARGGTVDDFLREAGFEDAGESQLEFEGRIRASELVTRCERRVWSRSWRLSDAQLAVEAAALRESLERQLGSLDGGISETVVFRVRVWRRAL